jgi:subtilisin family serine protease
VFSHGWHNTPSIADRLYRSFYGRLEPMLSEYAPDRAVLLLGVVWPARAWSDEPIPDFEPSPDLEAAAGGGASLSAPRLSFSPPPTPTDEDRETLRSAFAESQRATVDELVDLLSERPDTEAALARAKELVGELAQSVLGAHDGEGPSEGTSLAGSATPDEVFTEFTVALESQGVVGQDAGGAAVFGRSLGRLWDGVQQAARQASYWRMKERAGVVGENGLGPFLSRLLEQRPDLGLHLVGHSFGGRVVSYALKALPETVGHRPPVSGLTLLQAAFSHFAFASYLPFDTARSGALAGQDSKVAGKVVACYSRYDAAVGTMYPLASFLRRQDAAGIDDPTFRWGGLGHDGHQTGIDEERLREAGDRYGFVGPGLINIDCSSVVRHGNPPSGAHSDIIHDELAWVVMSAGGLVDDGTRDGLSNITPTESAMDGPSAPDPERRAHHEPRSLLRNSVIADALLDQDEQRRLLDLGPTEDVPADARLPVVIELSVEFEGGLVAAHARLDELWRNHVHEEAPRPVSDTYVPYRLDLSVIQAMVGEDLESDNRRQRAIYRVWPDFQVSGFIDASVSTVKADAAERAYAASGRGIVWAVVDSGIDAEHPHFADLDLRGTDVGSLHRDFSQGDPADHQGALTDEFGHGTHVAGILAGSLADDQRPGLRVFENAQDASNPTTGTTTDRTIDIRTPVRGMAPQAQLVSLKVLDGSGKGSSMNVVRALEYIRREVNGQSKLIRVHGVNLSVGYEFDAQWFACGQSPLCVEVDRLVRSGVVVVVAAGNTGYGTLGSLTRSTNVGITMTINDPGNAALAITVGSTHRDMPHTYGVSYFSSKGPTGDGRQKPDLVAPGERITSAAGGRKLANLAHYGCSQGDPIYVEDSGTSLAAPHVSGAIASFLSIRREFIGRPEEVKRIFVESATSLGRDQHFQGTGLVDLMRAIQAV